MSQCGECGQPWPEHTPTCQMGHVWVQSGGATTCLYCDRTFGSAGLTPCTRDTPAPAPVDDAPLPSPEEQAETRAWLDRELPDALFTEPGAPAPAAPCERKYVECSADDGPWETWCAACKAKYLGKAEGAPAPAAPIEDRSETFPCVDSSIVAEAIGAAPAQGEPPLFAKALHLVEQDHPHVVGRMSLDDAKTIVAVIETNADLHVKVASLEAENARLSEQLDTERTYRIEAVGRLNDSMNERDALRQEVKAQFDQCATSSDLAAKALADLVTVRQEAETLRAERDEAHEWGQTRVCALVNERNLARQEADVLRGLVLDLQAHAKEHGWQDVDDPIAALLSWQSQRLASPGTTQGQEPTP